MVTPFLVSGPGCGPWVPAEIPRWTPALVKSLSPFTILDLPQRARWLSAVSVGLGDHRESLCLHPVHSRPGCYCRVPLLSMARLW